jgi:hypothetical protein
LTPRPPVEPRRGRFAAASLLALALLAFAPVCALDDDEFGGYAADSLTVTVGYFGGPYYEKAVFTLDEMRAMNVVYADYTFIDNMPSVVIDHVAGVPLADLTEAAGIDLAGVQSFNFWTRDKQGAYYTSLTKRFLIDTPRYCYYSLPDNFDYDAGAGNAYATRDGVPVPAMLALADDWNRVLAGASFGSDYLNLNANTRFRLVFGQTDARTRTASNSAKWVHTIEITLGGAPTIVMDESVLELEVGSLFRSEARLSAADPAIAENAKLAWSSSDPSVATVDENGEIAVRAEGSATIAASYGGATATILVNGKPGGGGAPEADGGAGDAEDAARETSPAETETAEAASQGEQAAVAPQDAAKKTRVGREIAVLNPARAESEGDKGGVQNWRDAEMSDTAVEMPLIKENLPLIPLAVLALALFLLGGLVECVRYRAGLEDGV